MISTSHDPASEARVSPQARGGEALWRKILRTTHLWIALILFAPLFMLGVTGAMLVFDHELEDILDGTPRRIVAGGPEKPIGAIVAAARAAGPSGSNPTAYVAPMDGEHGAVVRLGARGAPPTSSLIVFVDPVSLEIMGKRQFGAGIVRQIFLLHANLLVTPGRTGREIVGWFGVVMLFLGVSGLVLWWPRRGQWRGAFGVRRGARGLRLHRELHGAVGIWSLAVFLVVSFSGTYLAFPQTIGDAIRAVVPARDLRVTPAVARPGEGARPLDVEALVAAARDALPEAAVRSVFFAPRPDQPVRVGLARPDDDHGAPIATAFVDPYTAKVVELRDPRRYTLGETVLAWQHALHAGNGLGWGWKTAVFLSGALPPLFLITGFMMWLIKRRARRAVAARRATAVGAGE